MKLIGIALIVVGVLALALGGIRYTKREKVLDLGPIEATTEKHKTIPVVAPGWYRGGRRRYRRSCGRVADARLGTWQDNPRHFRVSVRRRRPRSSP